MAGAKHALEHDSWKLVKELQLTEKKILVAFSGGIDSLALLTVLSQILPLKNLTAAYFHHGPGENLSYRDQAEKFCQDHCQKHSVAFLSLKSNQQLSSEEEFRTYRYEAFDRFLTQNQIPLLALGHHQDDLLETRLMRLIRGTGHQGLIAMQVLEGTRFRPFLGISKKTLKNYLHAKGLNALEDPSNQDLDPLRNWLRQDWLPQLEQRQPGAFASLARSLNTLVSEQAASQAAPLLPKALSPEVGIYRSVYLSLLPKEQITLLAQYLLLNQVRDFSQSHLEEIQKRLDNSQTVLTFKVAGCDWEVNAQQIRVLC